MKKNLDKSFRNHSWEWEYIMVKTWVQSLGCFKYLMKTDLQHNRNIETPKGENMVPEYLVIAAKMLDCKVEEINEDLENSLTHVAVMVEKTGGTLRSRQAIALEIWHWQRYFADNLG